MSVVIVLRYILRGKKTCMLQAGEVFYRWQQPSTETIATGADN
jgi:hypothetical protein